MSDIRLPDIAEFQGLVDHQALVAGLRQAYGAAIVIARINYGNTAIDQQADRNIDGLRAAGADALGWYCYLIAGQDPVAQADTFCRVLRAHGGLRSNEFVVVDDEEGAGDQSSRVDAFLARVDAVLQATATQDAWYSGLNFARAHNLASAQGHRWIAAYQPAEPSAPAHDLWQFTDAMSFPGVAHPCDASVFHGTLSDFQRLIGAAPPTPPQEDDDMGDIAYLDMSAQLSQQQIYWVDAAGDLIERWYDNTSGAWGGPLVLATGLAPRTSVTARADDEWKQVQLLARMADGRIAHLVCGYGSSFSSAEFHGAADGGLPVPAAVSALTSAVAAVKGELDTVAGEVVSGVPPNLTALAQAVATVDGHVAALSAHLGVGTA